MPLLCTDIELISTSNVSTSMNIFYKTLIRVTKQAARRPGTTKPINIYGNVQ